MQSSEFKNVSWDDVIFLHRNQAYGAYRLRKLYDTHVNLAFFIAVSLMVLLLLVPQALNFMNNDNAILKSAIPVDKGKTIDLILPPDIIEITEPLPKLPPAPKVKSLKKVESNVFQVVKKDIPAVEEFKPIANADIPDEEFVTDFGSETNTGSLTGSDTSGNSTTAPVETNTTFVIVEKMPVFGKGEIEMMKFIAKHYRVPNVSSAFQSEGVIYISLVVSNSGEVNDVKVVKGIGQKYDDEAIRVVKMMNAWKPGIQNGRPVNVRLMIPIRVKIN